MHILIIDDNQELLFGLEKLLNESSFTTHTASTLKEGQKAIDNCTYDLIILDWLLPDGSGVDFLAEMRKTYLATPVLLLSSKSEINEKVEALDNGADDYLQKPFSNIELMARIRALLRRESSYKKSEISIQNLKVDLATREVYVEEKAIELTKKEFELLELLLLNQQVVLTRYQINDHLNRDFDALKGSNLVDVHIKNLRKKLGSASILIETVRGVGFKIKAI
ncbi:response regulator transcription factor [bacterium]|nr:response regulator transcription factor [bacterium]MBU1958193.1 response regulator transcription factor [bacterium]